MKKEIKKILVERLAEENIKLSGSRIKTATELINMALTCNWSVNKGNEIISEVNRYIDHIKK